MFIFWDIDNTLIDYARSERNAIVQILLQERIEFDENKIVELWGRISKRYFNEFLSKRISFEEQGRLRMLEIFNFLGMRISERRAMDLFSKYREILESSWVLFDDVIPCLQQMEGIKMGIISNGQKKQQKQKLEYTGIEHYFEIQLYADEIGVKKPTMDIFLMAISESKAKKEDIWYVGDNLRDDIYPCVELGIKCIWINRENKNVDANILSINSLAQLKNIN